MLSNKEYFLWRRSTETLYPWLRQFHDIEFLKFERKRIADVGAWFKAFEKLPVSASSSKSVCYYVLPTAISRRWLTSAPAGICEVKGLSALRNCPEWELVAFFPESVKVPEDYSYVRINSFRKIFLFDNFTKSIEPMNAIEVEEWEPLEPDYIYSDVPFEPSIVRSLFLENLDVKESIAESLQALLESSPHVHHGISGISFVSIFDRSQSARGLGNVLQQLSPPEYREAPAPKGAFKGSNQEIHNGIRMRFAERIPRGRNVISSRLGRGYGLVAQENARRANFEGEYSYYGGLIERKDDQNRLFEQALRGFFETEIALTGLDDLLESSGVMRDLEANYDEDLWAQIASMRQIMPRMDVSQGEFVNFSEVVKKDIEIFLSDTSSSEFVLDVWVEMYIDQCLENLKREAMSLARAMSRDTCDLTLLKRARGNLADRAQIFRDDDRIRNVRYDLAAGKRKGRITLIRLILSKREGCPIDELWQELGETGYRRDYFTNKDTLKDALKMMQEDGQVYKDPKDRFHLT